MKHIEKYRYQKELSELLGIEENDYNTAISDFNSILYSKISEMKNSDSNLSALYSCNYDRVYNSGGQNCSFISEKCIDRYEKIDKVLPVSTNEYKDFISLYTEVCEFCNFEKMWILEYEKDDSYPFDETLNDLLYICKGIGNFFLEKTQDLYDKLYPNNKTNDKEDKVPVKTLGSKPSSNK